MLKLASLVAVGLAFEESTVWVDYFGWTCRDYTRVPDECRSPKAFSEDGVHAEDACFSCNEISRQEERRRQNSDVVICQNGCTSSHNTCLGRCDQCVSRCDTDLNICQGACDDFGIASSTQRPRTIAPRDDDSGFPWWIPVLIGMALLCLLCTACALLFLFCRPQEQQGDCGQAEDVPMMIASPQPVMMGQSCSAPMEQPCNSGCDAGGQEMPCESGDCGGGGGGFGGGYGRPRY